MDFRLILNENEAAGDSAPRQPRRSASLTQPPPPQQHQHQQHHPQQRQRPHPHPTLSRQQSLPSYPHEHSLDHAAHPHTSYIPNMVEYFREGSESVSPRTMPTSIPRDSAYNTTSAHRSPEIVNRVDLAPTSTPARVHMRGASNHSVASNNSSHSMDPVAQSPQFHHVASITPSPIQARPPDYFGNIKQTDGRPTVSPVENNQMPPPQYHQSPILQTKSMPPPTTPVLNSTTPSPLPGHTPLRSSPGAQSHVSGQVMAMSGHIVDDSPAYNQRKRSLDSVGEGNRAIKRIRQEEPPVWARRIHYGDLRPMQKYAIKPTHGQRPVQNNKTRVPSVSDAGPNGTIQPNPTQRPWESDNPARTEPSLDNNVPYLEFNRVIANFLHDNILEPIPPELGVLEIEARLGLLIDPNTGDRYKLPILSETPIEPEMGSHLRFESIMSVEQHRALNEYLNAETRKSLLKDRIQIKYEHLREKDSFYEIPESFLESLPPVVQSIRNRYRRHNPRLRVTTNQRTGRIKAQIIKFRVADLQISCPRNNFDVRISISLEVNYPDSTASLVEHRERNDMPMGRLKDRLSYKHQNVSVDLTQVTSEAGGNRLHELELELDTVLLVEQARLAHEGRPNDYERQVGVFMNYVRVINRACGST